MEPSRQLGEEEKAGGASVAQHHPQGTSTPSFSTWESLTLHSYLVLGGATWIHFLGPCSSIQPPHQASPGTC